MRLARAIDEGALDDTTRQAIISRATDGAEPHIRDLFERYLPEEKRTRRLGTAIEPATILALSGEAARGERLFLEAAGVQCRNCHRIGDKGSEVGPDLSRIGGKLDRAALLESILEPSKSIEAKYLTYLLQTTGGSTHVGLLAEKGAKEVTLKEAQDRIVRVPAGEVELLVPQPQSLMPELLLRDMTAQEVADLVAYLHSLR
jgi:putative heme-binding domain-containing protein